ncbi:MAG: hypothetical protein LBK60_02705 [Verrucomicrobiales bacterium]|jgi:hypothetical protein|nr:hypothetical protein [Verrucomicrobiales bacterium]
MFGFSKKIPFGKRKRKRSNLEFDFITGPAPVARPAVVKKSPSLTVKPAAEPAPKPAPSPAAPPFVDKLDAAGEPEPVFPAADSDPAGEPQSMQEEQPTMSSPFSEPAPIRATESIHRQKKEQGAVSKLLSGVVTAIIIFVLLVTGAAGYGGYVMWRQIEGHSATISQLEASTANKLATLQRDFYLENQRLAENLALTSQQIIDLNKQLADAQKTTEALRRAQTQLQRRIDNQDVAIERLRASTRTIR